MTACPARPNGSPIDRKGLDEACRRLYARSSRIIGWGSGSVFDYFHTLYPIELDYLVDNDERRWGQRRRGVEILPPGRLAGESGASTFVIVYSSAWPEILEQIATIGEFDSLPASAVFADGSVRARMAWAEQLAARTTVRAPRTGDAIVVQGPVVPGITATVLRATSAVHPADLMVLSTWDDTDRGLLDEARPFVDEIVLSPRPTPAGIQNRNCQIVSTRAGVRRATECGARMILKTRTDTAVLADAVFDRARGCLDQLDGTAPHAAGSRNRLIVPSSFTRKFLLYHPSDLVMLGDAADIARYWSAPLDPREGRLLSPERIDQPLAAVNLDGIPAECYLGVQFCRSLGRPIEATLEASWRFYRDLFMVVDNEWFDLLWYKNLSIPDAAVRVGPRQLVTSRFWQSLYAGSGPGTQDASAVDLSRTTLRSLTEGAC